MRANRREIVQTALILSKSTEKSQDYIKEKAHWFPAKPQAETKLVPVPQDSLRENGLTSSPGFPSVKDSRSYILIRSPLNRI